jgi:hypothetical protein
MGQIREIAPVKLFVGILSSIEPAALQAEQELQSLFGEIDLRSDSYQFNETSYYNEEMGSPIVRRFVAFAPLVEPSAIAGIKLQTNAMEARLAASYPEVARPVNLDPGYVELAKIVLASTKNFYHRILLEAGIYAEVTMHYEGGAWRPFPWTFPDFRDGRYSEFFNALRARYRAQLPPRR